MHKMSGFKDIHAEKFIQLPSVWHNNLMKYFSIITKLAPNFKKIKWIRFSKEIILFYAKKLILL